MNTSKILFLLVHCKYVFGLGNGAEEADSSFDVVIDLS